MYFCQKDQVENGDGSNGTKLRRILMNASGRATKMILIQSRANRKRLARKGTARYGHLMGRKKENCANGKDLRRGPTNVVGRAMQFLT